MAKYAKLAGITSALVIGLGGGVVLAVLNPLIPNEDATQIESAPLGGQSDAQHQDAVPTIGASKDSVAVVLPSAAQPDAGRADQAPDLVKQGANKVRAGAASELSAPVISGAGSDFLPTPKSDGGGNAAVASGLIQPADADMVARKPAQQQASKVTVGGADAMSVPTAAGDFKTPALPAQMDSGTIAVDLQGLPKVSTPSIPDVSTNTATPLVISEPQLDTTTQGAEPVQPAVDLALDIVTPGVTGQSGVKELPKKVVQAPDVVAALPVIPEHKRRVNKSGTFDTGSSRLATNGTAGFASRKTSETGIKFPNINSQITEAVKAEPVKTGALTRNAVSFSATGKPLLSIVLIDIGKDGLPNETLKKLTIPAAFALPADQANVGSLAQGFTDAGFEVLALSPRAVEMSLSGGLDQTQVDTVVGKIFTELPQAIGLIDRPTGDLQKDRRLVKSLVNSFGSTGHGLLTYAGGLNPVPRAAQQANVAAATVYRVLDGKGESPEIMIRVLNRAVLEARHSGQVIVLGTTAPKTVATIVNWTLSSKARGVALAPVSASLLLGKQ